MAAEALSLLAERVRIVAEATARQEIRRALHEAGSVSGAARALEMDRSNLRREMRRLGMR